MYHRIGWESSRNFFFFLIVPRPVTHQCVCVWFFRVQSRGIVPNSAYNGLSNFYNSNKINTTIRFFFYLYNS